MRQLLATLFVLVSAMPVSAQSFVHAIGNNDQSGGGFTSLATSASFSTTSGHLIFAVGVSYDDSSHPTVSSFTDSQSNTYATPYCSGSFFGSAQVCIAVAKVTHAGSTTVTANFSPYGKYLSVIASEYSGVDTLDVQANCSACWSNPAVTGSLTTTHATEAVLCGSVANSVGGSGSFQVGGTSGSGSRDNQGSGDTFDYFATGVLSGVTAQVTPSSGVASNIACQTFYLAGAGPAFPNAIIASPAMVICCHQPSWKR